MNIDIAIATWNRAALLGQVLEALGQLRVPRGVCWKVSVCDNNSTDSTRAVVEEAARRIRSVVEVVYLFEPRQGKSHALNRLIGQTSGDWVLFLDDDVLVSQGWLEAYVKGIERYEKAGCLGGPISPWLEKPARGSVAFLVGQYPAVFGLMDVDVDTRMAPPDVSAWGANMAVRREALPAEGFDADRGMMGGKRVSGEDVGMIEKVLESGYEGWLVAGARVRHWVPTRSMSVRHFWQWQAGIGGAWVLSRGKATRGRFGVPWWAWREFTRRVCRAGASWRPWPTRRYYDAVKDAAQYWGYLQASR